MFAEIALPLAVGLLGWAYQVIKPPPSKICGSPGGPAVTSPRVKLSDGRHLAYREAGVAKEEAKYKIIIVHGFDSSKDIGLPVPQELIEELKIYFLFFDRPGYGESDPDPSRSVKSEANDIQELADNLEIGSRFYVIGISMGAYPVYGCLKYIPHRLLGASLVVPFVHYWWPCLPSNLAKEAFKKLPGWHQMTFRIAHHFPWLINWWMSQKWSMMSSNVLPFSPRDFDILKKMSEYPVIGQEKIRQQGVYECLYRDTIAGYAKWEFDPMDLDNPFPHNEGSVHIWQGFEDRMIPFEINRDISEKVPWIQYHEVAGAGHLLVFETKNCEAILKALLLR
ncbi:uncharacterized protein LOC123207343 [Mangifera indica]|uniref:uncharacterized protein LOC123207343 n=1 Tax=Mangifera indica TaxID=29780 RepID=UPI001CF9D0EF|nr:uncharacterized protein LOC123207343 [Mangifera indica]